MVVDEHFECRRLLFIVLLCINCFKDFELRLVSFVRLSQLGNSFVGRS